MEKIAVLPELDPGFLPAALWNREYRKLAASRPSHPLAITLERANGAVSRFDTVVLEETPENAELNLRYIERLVKFLLWAQGGWRVTVAGAPLAAESLRKMYSPDGERAFDCAMMGRRIYDRDFTVVGTTYDQAPEPRDVALKLGGNFEGCRIGFDLGGSDRKCAAVIDGKVVHS